MYEKSQSTDIPADGVVNDLFKIEFPANISQVHFIKLRLYNEKGKEVASTFYWRSSDKYEGSKPSPVLLPPGLESLSQLKQTRLKTSFQTRKENGRHYIDAEIRNNTPTLASSPSCNC